MKTTLCLALLLALSCSGSSYSSSSDAGKQKDPWDDICDKWEYRLITLPDGNKEWFSWCTRFK